MSLRLFGIALLIVPGVLAGCQSNQPITLSAVVTEADVSPYLVPGPGRIVGQAFLRQAGGGVVTCAGEEAALVPAVSLVDDAMKVWAGGDEIDPAGLEQADLERAGLKRAIQWSRCDVLGNFEFNQVPPQPFWVLAAVRWRAGKDEPQGGMLARRITVSRAGDERVILAQHDTGYLRAKPWQIWNAGSD